MRLAAAGYGVFGMDYEGHGKSMGARCYIRSFRRLVDDCGHFFKSVCGGSCISRSDHSLSDTGSLNPVFFLPRRRA